MKNLVVYTALFTDKLKDLSNDYGGLVEYTHDKNGVDYVAFTNLDIKSDFWEIQKVEPEFEARLQCRWYKMHPHLLFPEHKTSLWMDNQCYALYKPEALCDLYLTDADLAIHKHTDMTCLYKEAQICKMHNLDAPETIDAQVAKYKDQGHPWDYGLYETGIVMRRNKPEVTRFNEHWWSEIINHSIRDQISAPYVVRTHPDVRFYKIPYSFTAHQGFLDRPKSPHFKTLPRKKIPTLINNKVYDRP